MQELHAFFLMFLSIQNQTTGPSLVRLGGDQKADIGAISLGGKPLPVNPHLENALQYLRLAEKPRIDDEEKTHPVQHTRTIYELASRVVIENQLKPNFC